MKQFSIRLYQELDEVFTEYRDTVKKSNNQVVVQALEEFFQKKGLLPTEEERINNIKSNGNKQKAKPSN